MSQKDDDTQSRRCACCDKPRGNLRYVQNVNGDYVLMCPTCYEGPSNGRVWGS